MSLHLEQSCVDLGMNASCLVFLLRSHSFVMLACSLRKALTASGKAPGAHVTIKLSQVWLPLCVWLGVRRCGRKVSAILSTLKWTASSNSGYLGSMLVVVFLLGRLGLVFWCRLHVASRQLVDGAPPRLLVRALRLQLVGGAGGALRPPAAYGALPRGTAPGRSGAAGMGWDFQLSSSRRCLVFAERRKSFGLFGQA